MKPKMKKGPQDAFSRKKLPWGKWLIELMKFWLLLLKYGYRISIAYGLDMFFTTRGDMEYHPSWLFELTRRHSE